MQTFDSSKVVVLRSAYGPKIKVEWLPDPKELPHGRTKQSFKDECDINTIIKRFLRTGQLDLANKLEPRYGDCTGIEFQNAVQLVASARSLFEELPAALRNRFENEPAKFLLFVQDEKNYDEALKLGLVNPRPKAGSDPVLQPAEPVQEKPAA